jgi:hypothetical protein
MLSVLPQFILGTTSIAPIFPPQANNQHRSILVRATARTGVEGRTRPHNHVPRGLGGAQAHMLGPGRAKDGVGAHWVSHSSSLLRRQA